MKKINVLNGHSNRVLYMKLSPCGKYIVTGSGDHNLLIWKIFP